MLTTKLNRTKFKYSKIYLKYVIKIVPVDLYYYLKIYVVVNE